AVDCGLGDEIAIKRDRASGVVIAGNRKHDAVGIGVGIDDCRDRNIEALCLLDRDVFLVGVDHEDEVGHTAHIANAAERTLEFFLLARKREPLFLGVSGARFGR